MPQISADGCAQVTYAAAQCLLANGDIDYQCLARLRNATNATYTATFAPFTSSAMASAPPTALYLLLSALWVLNHI